MDSQERLSLIERNTEEVVKEEELKDLLEEDNPKGYIGFAPTSSPHIGHATTLRKVADFLEAGIEFDILVADEHARLDTEKTDEELVDARSEFYENAMKGMISASGADPDDINVVRGSDFQNSEEYVRMQRAFSTEMTANEAMNATGDVTDEGDGMKLSHLDYVAMQSVDVPALNADIALGGIDQRGIYMVARDRLPSIGEEKPTCVFTPLLTGLQGGKMSSSNVSSKIGVMDDEEDVYYKINEAHCKPEELEENGVMEYAKHLVFPVLESWGENFEVQRKEKFGGDVTHNTYDELEDHFLGEHPEHNDSLHPDDLKQATAGYISQYLETTREESDINPELQQKAFPEEY